MRNREAQRLASRERRAQARGTGICSGCAFHPVEPGKLSCRRCLERAARAKRKSRATPTHHISIGHNDDRTACGYRNYEYAVRDSWVGVNCKNCLKAQATVRLTDEERRELRNLKDRARLHLRDKAKKRKWDAAYRERNRARVNASHRVTKQRIQRFTCPTPSIRSGADGPEKPVLLLSVSRRRRFSSVMRVAAISACSLFTSRHLIT